MDHSDFPMKNRDASAGSGEFFFWGALWHKFGPTYLETNQIYRHSFFKELHFPKHRMKRIRFKLRGCRYCDLNGNVLLSLWSPDQRTKIVENPQHQVIQAVPFSSPNVGGHVFTPWKGHVNSPSEKGHGLNHQELVVYKLRGLDPFGWTRTWCHVCLWFEGWKPWSSSNVGWY